MPFIDHFGLQLNNYKGVHFSNTTILENGSCNFCLGVSGVLIFVNNDSQRENFVQIIKDQTVIVYGMIA